MPSTPGYPAHRATAWRPAGRREFESFAQYDSGFLTLAANANFQEVVTFSGRPDSIQFQSSAAGVNIRIRNRGQAAYPPIRVAVTGTQTLGVTGEIVEAQDPTGAGGQVIVAIGRFGTRGIDQRNNFPGPFRDQDLLPHIATAIQAIPGP